MGLNPQSAVTGNNDVGNRRILIVCLLLLLVVIGLIPAMIFMSSGGFGSGQNMPSNDSFCGIGPLSDADPAYTFSRFAMYRDLKQIQWEPYANLGFYLVLGPDKSVQSAAIKNVHHGLWDLYDMKNIPMDYFVQSLRENGLKKTIETQGHLIKTVFTEAELEEIGWQSNLTCQR